MSADLALIDLSNLLVLSIGANFPLVIMKEDGEILIKFLNSCFQVSAYIHKSKDVAFKIESLLPVLEGKTRFKFRQNLDNLQARLGTIYGDNRIPVDTMSLFLLLYNITLLCLGALRLYEDSQYLVYLSFSVLCFLLVGWLSPIFMLRFRRIYSARSILILYMLCLLFPVLLVNIFPIVVKWISYPLALYIFILLLSFSNPVLYLVYVWISTVRLSRLTRVSEEMLSIELEPFRSPFPDVTID